MRFDLTRERFTDRIARKLEYLQSVRGYRWIIRTIFLPGFEFYFGVSAGQRWFQYHRIDNGKPPERLDDRHRFHFMAKLAGMWVGSVRLTPSREGYRIDDLYVRIRYRGMGVGSKLLALTATAASRSEPAVLLASVEAANTVALDAFRKAGFGQMAGRDGNAVCLRRDLHDRAGGS